MSAGEEITPQQFADAFQRVAEWAVYEGRHGRSPFKERLTEHFGEDPATYPLMTETVAPYEPALAARPGRVDQAVAFPLPDADARSQLLDLFGRGLDIHLTDRVAIVAETEGVSPAFLRELVRKAALHAARAGSPRVEDSHFREALDLLERAGPIARSMLGADGGAVERLDAGGAWGEVEWDEE